MNAPFQGTDFDLPPGSIICWQGLVDQIPRGWAFCDGNNGTPDLRGKYPKSVTTASSVPGTTGGTHTKTISNAQLPSHSHNGSVADQTSNHTHRVWSDQQGANDNGYGDTWKDNTGDTVTSTTDGNHSHNLNVGSTGSGQSIDNEPVHITLGFIQRL